MPDQPKIVILAFDGFPLTAFGLPLTPNMWRLGEEGGFAPDGGRTGLPSTTYPSFATLLTGAFDAAALLIAESEDKEKTRREVGNTLTLLLEALRSYATTTFRREPL